ncbi:MAG: GTPase ObgE [Lachnospiraceae bacterium]|jgi:GTP-binding protein|nr:GTPase ObgE [Lachnospiraceae bacterium]MCI1329086.1 GTPase ObgE [Lachnospiraceae bacterium]
MFADRAKITVRSGKGGDGHVSFRREKFVAAGGPDGGDGGRGGDVIFEIDPGMNTLADYRHRRKFAAGNGGEGEKRRRHGSDGDDLILKVPEGTVIYDDQSGKVIADLSGENRHVVLLKGGRGGRGNMNFATATMQVPQFAQPGGPARELTIRLELKLIADVGLIGFPNVGKSTLLSRISNAAPKIGDYHFTTIQPNLGVVDLDGGGFVAADIPGLIEGASDGAGLGIEFLRHIERTRLFIHVVDASGSEGRDPIDDVNKINSELAKYSEDLSKRPQVIAANKTDLIYQEYYDETGEESPVERLKKEFEPKGIPVFPISGATGAGIRELLYSVQRKLSGIPKESMRFQPEIDVDEILPPVEHLPYTIVRSEDEENVFIVEGPKIEKMLGYTNLDSEKGFAFFQKFLSESGILKDLEEAGVKDGDTIRMYGHTFEYYK